MSIGRALARCAENYGGKLALKDWYGKVFPAGASFTWSQLDAATNRLARHFLGMGLRRGDRVAVQTGTGTGHVLSLFALAKAGLAIAPIDRSYLEEELVYQVNDAGARAFVVDADLYRVRVEGLRPRLPTVERYIGIGEEHGCAQDFQTLLREGSAEPPGVEVSEEDVITLIYTSGTTGRPKGVPQTHRRWLFSAHMWAAELGLHPYTRELLPMPLHTSGGTGLSLACGVRGAALILSPPDPESILRLLEAERITLTQFSPTLLAKVIRHPSAARTDVSSLERWFTSAAPISAELLAEGAGLLGPKFTQLYGTTETALLGTVLRPEEVAVEGPLARRLTSIGKASLGYETLVVDEDGNPVGPGGTGELLLRGGGVAPGYWNRPAGDDFRDGWWCSGDVVRIDEDGFYYVVDRKKDMIVSGGNNVYPREVEDVISSHPAVHLVAVIGVPDPLWGESVKAVIVTKEGSRVTEDEIVEHCRARMASYKKPKSVDFIPLSEMPMIGGGYKILKRELRERYRKAPQA